MAWLNFTVPGTTEKEMRVNSDTYAIEVKSGTEWISCYQTGYRVTPGLVASVDEAAGTCQVKEDVASASTVPRFYRLKIPLVGESGLMIDSVFLPSSLFPSGEGGGSGISDEERERLLPEVANNNEIMIWRDSVDRGNNADTRLLLQPATSDNEIIDQAKGNAAPVQVVNSGVTVNGDGDLVFDGSGYLRLERGALPESVLASGTEWTLDLAFLCATDAPNTVILFGRGLDDLRMDFMLWGTSLSIGSGPGLNGDWQRGVWQRLTFELYQKSGEWKYTAYQNGRRTANGSWGSADWRSRELWIGWDGCSGGRQFKGLMRAIRLTSGAVHRGKETFIPLELPWLPTGSGWQKADLAELVKTIIDEYPFPDPVTELPVVDATFGRCRYLGIPNAQLTFADPVWQLKSVKMLIRSIADDVTGNIVIVPVVDGVEKPELSVVVPVGATWATVEIPLAIETGELILKRDVDDERDTLKDAEGVAVTAVIRSIREIIGNV